MRRAWAGETKLEIRAVKDWVGKLATSSDLDPTTRIVGRWRIGCPETLQRPWGWFSQFTGRGERTWTWSKAIPAELFRCCGGPDADFGKGRARGWQRCARAWALESRMQISDADAAIVAFEGAFLQMGARKRPGGREDHSG